MTQFFTPMIIAGKEFSAYTLAHIGNLITINIFFTFLAKTTC